MPCADCGAAGPLARTGRTETGRDVCTPCLYAHRERELQKHGRHSTWPPTPADPEALRADFEERAAIVEHMGNKPRAEAERIARRLVYGSDATLSE